MGNSNTEYYEHIQPYKQKPSSKADEISMTIYLSKEQNMEAKIENLVIVRDDQIPMLLINLVNTIVFIKKRKESIDSRQCQITIREYRLWQVLCLWPRKESFLIKIMTCARYKQLHER